MNPKISIITISYNSADCIEETIRSVIYQDYAEKEYLIIDGASTDGTLDIVNKYRDKIDTIVSEKDKGISDAFNKGIKAATGDLIVLINSGDMLAPDGLQKVVDHYKPGYDLYCGNVILWNPDTDYKAEGEALIKYARIPFHYRPWHQGCFITKQAYEKYGLYSTEYKQLMDLELMLRYTRLGAKFCHIEERVAIFRLGGVSQSGNSKRRWEERRRVLIENGRTKIESFIWLSYLHVRECIKSFVILFGEDARLLFVNKKIEK